MSAVAIWLAGFDVYKKGLTALRHGRININALMTVAVTGAFAIGQWPAAAMVMALFAIAEAIEARAVDRARHAIERLLEMAPEVDAVRQPDGSWPAMPVASVALDAVVRVRPGERVPMDGVLTAGSSSIDQAPVTGESVPVDKAVGDAVFAGTINQTGTFEFRVTALASNSTLARIIHAVEEAQATRAPTQVSSSASPPSTRRPCSRSRWPWPCSGRGCSTGRGCRRSTGRSCCWSSRAPARW